MRTHSRAFTLIELVMVLLITGILAVVAVATISNLAETRVDLAAAKLRSDIRYAQVLAVTTQQRAGIFFDVGANTYTVSLEGPVNVWTPVTDPQSRQPLSYDLDLAPYSGLTLADVIFVSAGRALVFDRWGDPYGYDTATQTATALASFGQVSVQSGAVQRTITVQPGGGYVSSS